VDAVAQVFNRYLHEKGVGVALEGKKLTDDFPDEAGNAGDSEPAVPEQVTRLPGNDTPSPSRPEQDDRAPESEAAPMNRGQARPDSSDADCDDADPELVELTEPMDVKLGTNLNIIGGEICKLCGGGPVEHRDGCDFCHGCNDSYNCGN
jgi:hypothetical protein